MHKFLSRTLCLIILPISLIAADPAYPTSMRKLVEVQNSSAPPYLPARCAGLYQAMMEWIGYARMDAGSWNTMDNIRQQLMLAATFIGQETSGNTLQQESEFVVRTVRDIADLYIQRMKNNYASGGQAFGDDTLIQSDLGFCKAVIDTLS